MVVNVRQRRGGGGGSRSINVGEERERQGGGIVGDGRGGGGAIDKLHFIGFHGQPQCQGSSPHGLLSKMVLTNIFIPQAHHEGEYYS
ncbi:hypothetical protein L6452_19477 [Arctium lappa]|uniref:Uncharacterized protein n=1 Tax=Arctium lappa TaxID=4217 RepID=A0ACB9B9J6_ARCLA|nr:hypothetical protein L6452_19477 [Arctium lappa]